MSSPISVTWMEDGSAVIMARVEDRPTSQDADGTALVQANLSSIAYSVYDRGVPGAGSTPVVVTGHNNVSLTVSAVIFDTLQGWDVDSRGHNFRYTVAGSAFPNGRKEYMVEVSWTHTDGRVGATQWAGAAHPRAATL